MAVLTGHMPWPTIGMHHSVTAVCKSYGEFRTAVMLNLKQAALLAGILLSLTTIGTLLWIWAPWDSPPPGAYAGSAISTTTDIVPSGEGVKASSANSLTPAVRSSARIRTPTDRRSAETAGESVPGSEALTRLEKSQMIQKLLEAMADEEQPHDQGDAKFEAEPITPGEPNPYEVVGFSGGGTGAGQQHQSGSRLAHTRQPGRTGINGQVIDAETKEPIAEFEVCIAMRYTTDFGDHAFGKDWIQFSSPIGAFFVPVDGGSEGIRIEARSRRHASTVSERSPVPRGQIIEGVVLELQPGAYVSGIVLDTDTGNPIPGVAVKPVSGAIRNWVHGMESFTESDAKTGPDGRFELFGLPLTGEIDLLARRPDFAPGFAMNVPPDEEETTIHLHRGGTLKGTVSRNGQPIEKLRVRIQNPFGQFLRPFHPADREGLLNLIELAHTEADGSYEITALPPGRYSVAFYDVSARKRLGKVWIDIPDKKTTQLNVDLAVFGTVQGTILGGEPSPYDIDIMTTEEFSRRYKDGYDGVELHLYAPGAQGEPLSYVQPGKSGGFIFTPVMPGDYVVRAVQPGHDRIEVIQALSLAPGRSVSLVLEF